MQGEDDKVPRDSMFIPTKSRQKKTMPYMPADIQKLTSIPEALPKYIRLHLEEHQIPLKNTLEPVTRSLKSPVFQNSDLTLMPSNEGLRKQKRDYEISVGKSQNYGPPISGNSMKKSQSRGTFQTGGFDGRANSSDLGRSLPIITYKERDKIQREAGPLLTCNLFITDAANNYEPNYMPHNRKIFLQTVKMSRSPQAAGMRLHSAMTETMKFGFTTLPVKNRNIMERSFEFPKEKDPQSREAKMEKQSEVFVTQSPKETVDLKPHMEKLKEQQKATQNKLKKLSRMGIVNGVAIKHRRERHKNWRENAKAARENVGERERGYQKAKGMGSKGEGDNSIVLTARNDYHKLLLGDAI